jgi:hypothetical protein
MEGVTQDMPVSHSSAQDRANPSVISVLSPSMEDKAPVPMSFPSILRNSGLTSRYAHLVGPTGSPTVPVQPKKVWRRNDNEGKRWVRRRENGASDFTMHALSLPSLPHPSLAPQPKLKYYPGSSTKNSNCTARFTDNPHVAVPSKRDLEPSLPIPHTTFPIPLPPYLPRSAPLSGTVAPTPDAKASNAGQFSLSMRGMRKVLRRSGARTQALVRGVEDELMRWLGGVEIVLDPDQESGYQFPGRAVAGQEDIREVERSPQRLVWWIENDTWVRYVVHCCARYHNIVSFSTSIQPFFPLPFFNTKVIPWRVRYVPSPLQAKTPQHIVSRISCVRMRRDRTLLCARYSQRPRSPTETFLRTHHTILMHFPRHCPTSSRSIAD